MVEVTFLRGLFLSQDVTVISMLSLDFAGTGESEALSGSGFCFHFRHYFTVFFNKLDYIVAIALGLLLLGRNDDEHALAFEPGHGLGFAIVHQGLCELEELGFALLFVDDGTSAEEDIDLHLIAFFKETLGVVELELKVVVVGLRAETDFFDDHFGGVGFALFVFLLLLVEILLVLYDSAHRRIGIGGNHHQVKTFVVCSDQRLFGAHDGGFHTFAHHTDHGVGDALVDQMFCLFLLRAFAASSVVIVGGAWGNWYCYNLVLLCLLLLLNLLIDCLLYVSKEHYYILFGVAKIRIFFEMSVFSKKNDLITCI